MENQRTLSDNMSIGRKIGLLLDYLQNGGDVQINGYTWVWLDNHITRTTTDEKGNPHHWGIDGLAIKCMRIDSRTGEKKPHYMGQNDMTLQAFVQLVENVKEEDWLGMCASNALQSLNKERQA